MSQLVYRMAKKFLEKPVKIGENIILNYLEQIKSCTFVLSSTPYHKFTENNFFSFISSSYSIIENPSIEVDSLTRLSSSIKGEYVIGVGGGRIMDASKYLARILHKKLILIPSVFTTTSWLNTAIALRKNNSLFFAGQKYADLCIVDTHFIVSSPSSLNMGGLVDVLVAWTALTDWNLEKEKHNKKPVSKKLIERYRHLIDSVMENVSLLKPFTKNTVRFLYDVFLDSLALCGSSFSGRPLEGSEHFLYYLLDEKTPYPLVHGPIIALTSLISLRLQEKKALYTPDDLISFFDSIGVPFRLQKQQFDETLLDETLKNISLFCKEKALPYSIWNVESVEKILENNEERKKIVEWVASL